MEIAHWLEWDDCKGHGLPEGRIYLGTETCQRLLPSREILVRSAADLKNAGRSFTFVIPFVGESAFRGLEALLGALEKTFPESEAVCNDWGVLCLVAEGTGLTPVIGRLLVRQKTDPRLAMLDDKAYQESGERDVRHRDGTVARLKHLLPDPTLVESLEQVPLDGPDFPVFLKRYRVDRMEINNTLQGIRARGVKLGLHVPDVLVAVARTCRDFPESAPSGGDCSAGSCSGEPTIRLYPGFPVPLYRKDNALFYLNAEYPAECDSLGIDRIIYRKVFHSATAGPMPRSLA
jgi:hypothetical protein